MGQRFRGYDTVSRRHRCHLSLQQLQDHIYISCHPGLQSLETKRGRERLCPHYDKKNWGRAVLTECTKYMQLNILKLKISVLFLFLIAFSFMHSSIAEHHLFMSYTLNIYIHILFTGSDVWAMTMQIFVNNHNLRQRNFYYSYFVFISGLVLTCWAVTVIVPGGSAAGSVCQDQHRRCDGDNRLVLQMDVSDSLSTDWPCGRPNSRISQMHWKMPLFG